MRRKSPTRARAPRVVLWALGTFLLVQLGVGVALDCWGADLRFPYAASQVQQVERLPRAPAVIGVGSSRMGLCFRAAEVAHLLRDGLGDSGIQVYNAAVPRGDLLTDEFVFAGLLQRGAKPDVLVVEISPESLARYNDWLDTDIKNQLTWADMPRVVRELRFTGAPQLRSLLSSRVTPIYLYRQQLRHELALDYLDGESANRTGLSGGSGKEEWADVYNRLSDPANFQQRTQLMLPGLRAWLRNYEIGGLPARALKKLLRRCRREGVQVVLVGMPVTASYRACYSPELLVSYRAHLNQLIQRYGCRFVDFQGTVPDQYFWDGYHVLAEGGQQFSRRLTADVLMPMLMKHHTKATP